MTDWIFKQLQSLFGLTIEWRWVAELFLVVLAVVTINFAVRLLLAYARKLAKRTSTSWDDALLCAVSSPLRTAMWVLGITIAADIAVYQIGQMGKEVAPVFELIGPTRQVGIIACIGWFIMRLIKNVTEGLQQRYVDTNGERGIDHQTGDAVSRLLRVAVLITFVLVILQNMGFSISGVMAFGGVGGIAVGFAAKDILANFFGGLFIFLDKPFYVGDWICSPDQDIEGTVELIGWRRTVVRRFNKRPLYIPNAVFNTIAVENPSRMTNRRIYETIGVRYSDATNVSAIVDGVKAMLRKHDEIDQDQTMIVNFDKFGASSLDIFVYTFTKTTDWVKFHTVKHEVLLKIYDVIQQQGGDVAFPTQTLHINQQVNEE